MRGLVRRSRAILRGAPGALPVELQGDLVAAAGSFRHAHHARRRFRLCSRSVAIERVGNPNAGTDVAAFAALNQEAAAPHIDGVCGREPHAQRSTPSETSRKAELRTGMLAQFGWDRHAIHGGHRSLGAMGRQTEAKVERRGGN